MSKANAEATVSHHLGEGQVRRIDIEIAFDQL
jgi:hypothetical protein